MQAVNQTSSTATQTIVQTRQQATEGLAHTAGEAERSIGALTETTERTLTGVTGNAETTLNKVFTHFENLWLGRTEAISGQIEQRTRAVARGHGRPVPATIMRIDRALRVAFALR